MKYLRYIVIIAVALGLSATIFGIPTHTFAQDGLTVVQETTGLGAQPLPVIIARLIRVALSVLGIIAVLIVMYGGYTWMTAGGSAEKVERAKKILISGGIGLAIILMSWAITTFVLSALLNATGNTGTTSSTGPGSGGGGPPGLGGGSSTSFVVTSILPEGDVSIRNIQIQATFSRFIDRNSVGGNVVVERVDTGEAVEGTVTTVANRLTFVPNTSCPEPNEDRFCFDANTSFRVRLLDGIESTTGVNLDCLASTCEGTFTSGELVDVLPPEVFINQPEANATVVPGSTTGLEARATDDAAVTLIDFGIDGEVLDSLPATGENRTNITLESSWNTTGYEDNTSYVLFARATDIAGNEAEATRSVRIGPAFCYNGELDTEEGETDIDCGGVCGSCGGNTCSEDSECASGVCSDAGQCVQQGGVSGNPTIQFLSPEQGPVGQYVTITGTNLGYAVGKVEFVHPDTGDVAIAGTDFPAVCGGSNWNANSVTVIVPSEYQSGFALEPVEHQIVLTRNDGAESNDLAFQVTSGEPTPGICAVTPSIGQAGDTVIIKGERFGNNTAFVRFNNEVNATISEWRNDQINVTVPEGATTGLVYVESQLGQESNRVPFEIGRLDNGSTGSSTEAAYAWSFSTGAIPTAPALIEACTTDRISSVPNARFTTGACVNAQVYAEFTTEMDLSTLIEGETVIVEQCNNASCSNRDIVNGTLSVSSNDDVTSFSWLPEASYNGGVLLTGTAYRVTVTTDVRSVSGGAPIQEMGFNFTTRNENTLCEVESVTVSPASKTLENQGDTAEYLSLARTADCQVLDPRAYTWDWFTDQGIASIEEGVCREIEGDQCAVVTALAEGRAEVTARETASSITGSGEVVVNFRDPYVVHFWPSSSCTTACVEADVGARFNTAMNPDLVQGSRLLLQECTNELCLSFNQTVSLSPSCLPSDDDKCYEITFGAGLLKAGTYYRATVSGDIQSLSGVPLTRLNYGNDFSWIFATRSEDISCDISRIDLLPDTARLREVGDRQPFYIEAHGNADQCSVAGQRLNPYNFDWDWEDPISDDENVAHWVSVNTTGVVDPQSRQPGALLDANRSSIHPGCTDTCLPAGSSSYLAICGNGTLEVGEECEDGNSANGDGCSALCLREGNSHIGTCGDGIRDRLPNGAGEDCDDGNNVNGDGCSAQCLNEGANTVQGATCGNGSVGYFETIGGEDCDDGNRINGDGCSSMCLNEGGVSDLSIFAVCGNGEIEEPYETCDDGNRLNGDGCSNRCLREGYLFDAEGTRSVCGAGAGGGTVNRLANGAGEDCDDGNNVNGDGCSARCLLEGSSLSYSIPSVCGDGIYNESQYGEYELCEVGTGADGNIDPAQVAEISQGAASLVSTDTHLATATIRVSAADYNLSEASTLTLSCTAESDNDCSDASVYGIGENRCCSVRPDGQVFPAGDDVCRNAALYGVFDQVMDSTTFNKNVFLELDLASTATGVCPSSHRTLTDADIAALDRSWLARAWVRVRGAFVRTISAQQPGACVVPITSVSQQSIGNGQFRVDFFYRTVLEPLANYSLVVVGDDIGDDEVKGVKNTLGVGLNGNVGSTFTTTDGICNLDAVEVRDTNTSNPNTFTQSGEVHTFNASAISYSGGRRLYIQDLPGVYEWEWSTWEEDSQSRVVDIQDSTGAASEVVATLESGKATVVAEAHVTFENGQATDGKRVTGRARITSTICENPWPSIDSFPFIDNAETTVPGAEEGAGWMNFGTYFCRDAGRDGTSDDLPSVSLVLPPRAESPGILKEYLFKVTDGSGDAIGMRVASNPQYLSPADWYRSQGFTGNPVQTVVDGFQAVQDGRTVYISAPNVAGDPGFNRVDTYANIYILSYNDGARQTTVDIFSQMIENFELLTNVEDTGLCVDAGGVFGEACSSDSQCAVGVCANDKAKLTRDIKRLTDIRTIESALTSYGAVNGRCSATTSQSCSSSAECPAGETCRPSNPTLPSGTYIPALASSAWDSWQDTLSEQVGRSLPTDPLNAYEMCGSGDAVNLDAETCVDTTQAYYECFEGSHAYHYRSVGPFSYELAATLEFASANWLQPISTSANHDVYVGGSRSLEAGFNITDRVCRGVRFGATNTCGDGIVSSSEVCEIGDQGAAELCDINGDGTMDGTRSQACNATCSAFESSPGAQCIPFSCGNGVVEAGEDCDDGDRNGDYGFCGNACTYASAFYCGDGSVSGGEACDCSADQNGSVSGRTFGGGFCSVTGAVNGSYASNSADSCAWNCQGPAPYCGDGIVQSVSGEQCDGGFEVWSGTVCSDGEKVGEACTVNADCGAGGVCGGTSSSSACPVSRVCIDGASNLLGTICSVDSQCNSSGLADGRCSENTLQTERLRTCNETSCNWNTDFLGIECLAPLTCGNGVVDEGEQCDDGNENSTDGCTNECRLNVCGDGYIYAGVEACDAGSQNGELCTSAYESTCSFCSDSCQLVATSGAFCGDGVINGGEYCDGGDIPYLYVSQNGDIHSRTCTQAEYNAGTFLVEGGDTYTCSLVGICNGGVNNGMACSGDQALANCGDGGGVCTFPTCSGTCSSACPFTLASTAVQVKSNLPGSPRTNEVTISSFNVQEGQSAVQETTAATLYVPACRAADGFTATVDFGFDLEPTFVAFVTDRSGSMRNKFSSTGPSRMELTQDVIQEAIGTLFDELPNNVSIGLYSYGTGATFDSEGVCATGFCSHDYKSLLNAEVESYEPDGDTYMKDALLAAWDGLDSVGDENDRRIIVFLTDGNPNPAGTQSPDVQDPYGSGTSVVRAIKNSGIEVYTVGIMSPNNNLASLMAFWSSGNPDPNTGIDYAYADSSAESLASAFRQIVDAISGVAFSFLSGTNRYTGIIQNGFNVSLPWPENFSCNPVSEQPVPVRVYFDAEGTVTISNVRVNTCAP